MSTEMKEQLSALMDGEGSRDATRFVLRALAADPALAASWSRLHVARDCLRRETTLVVDTGFAAAVMARIDAETAPAQSGSRWLRYLSGGAVAAAVAVVALMVSAPEPESPSGQIVAGSVAPPPALRAPAFNDSVLQPHYPQLAQPASATVGGNTFFSPGYDLRAQPSNGWRPADPSLNLRMGDAPYVLLLVPVQPLPQNPPAPQPRLQ